MEAKKREFRQKRGICAEFLCKNKDKSELNSGRKPFKVSKSVESGALKPCENAKSVNFTKFLLKKRLNTSTLWRV